MASYSLALGNISTKETKIITPAEKLNDKLSNLGLNRLDTRPSKLPSPVQRPAARVSRKANNTR